MEEGLGMTAPALDFIEHQNVRNYNKFDKNLLFFSNILIFSLFCQVSSFFVLVFYILIFFLVFIELIN